MNRLHAGVVFLSVVLCVPLAAACVRQRLTTPLMLLGTIALGLLVNAATTGGLAGVFGRYEGRVVWLLPLWVLVSAWTLAGGRAKPPGRLAPVTGCSGRP
nr:hypothetical protein [uncultured Rhodopila sp.]